MAELTIAIAEGANEADARVIAAGLTFHGEARSEPRRFRRLAVLARDEAGHLVGGLTGVTVWGWLEIELLWVAEEHRGRALGARLMTAAEEEAAARGCRHARVDTFDFQAPRFYARLGYEEYAVLEDFPPGHTRHFLKKDLAAAPERAGNR